jgi:hypothetical protein
MMYPDVHFLEGKLVTVGEVRVRPLMPRRHTFFSVSFFQEVEDQSTM